MGTIHPNIEKWLKEFNAEAQKKQASGFFGTVINSREQYSRVLRSLLTDIPDIALVNEGLIVTPGRNIPVRYYHPDPAEALPVLLFFHGGGHTIGCVSDYEPICRKLALASRHIVVSVEYRLAPENPYPAGPDDCILAAKHLWPSIWGWGIKYRPELSIGGDSAGGALTAMTTGRLQWDASVSIKKQVLIYPSVDFCLRSPTIDQLGKGYWLEKPGLFWFFDQFLQNGVDRRAVSPLYQEISDRMPSALIVTGGFDPLSGEGIAYADKLAAAGIAVEHLHFDDMIHPFLCLEDLAPEACAATYGAIGKFLQG